MRFSRCAPYGCDGTCNLNRLKIVAIAPIPCFDARGPYRRWSCENHHSQFSCYLRDGCYRPPGLSIDVGRDASFGAFAETSAMAPLRPGYETAVQQTVLQVFDEAARINAVRLPASQGANVAGFTGIRFSPQPSSCLEPSPRIWRGYASG